MDKAIVGVGIGFRVALAEAFLERQPQEVAWVEMHPENYVGRGGLYKYNLDRVRELYPVISHGLTLSLAANHAHNTEFVKEVRDFLAELGTPWHSDHLCFGGAHSEFLHDLVPVPFTEEAAKTIAQRFDELRDQLDIQMAMENVSYYVPLVDDPLDEAHFVAELLAETDGKILLDVNNVYVNSQNFDFDPKKYIDLIPPERVIQMHVAGHLIRPDGLRIDTHGESICDDVFELLEYALGRTGPRPVLLERDNNIPPLDEVLAEVRQLNEVYARGMKRFEASQKATGAADAAQSPTTVTV